MAFLEIGGLDTVSIPEVRDMLTDTNDDIIIEIIEESIDIMKGYIRNHYDVNAVFEAEGADRSKTVLKYLKDIVVYELYIRQTIEMNEVAKIRFDEAMLWLDKVASGKLNLDLPRPDEDGDGEPDEPFLWLTSKPKYDNIF